MAVIENKSKYHNFYSGYKKWNLLTSTNVGEVTIQITTLVAQYKHSFPTNKTKFFPLDNFQKIGILKFERETNFIIRGFLASQPRSPLIVCFPFQAFQIIEVRSIQPIDFLSIIKLNH